MINKIIFQSLSFFSIFSLLFNDLNYKAFNEKYFQSFSESTWLLLLTVNPIIYYLVLTIWVYKSKHFGNIKSNIIERKLISNNFVKSILYILTTIISIYLIIYFSSFSEKIVNHLSNYNLITRVFYGGVFEEYIFRFCIPNILFSFAFFKDNHLKLNITQAFLFAILHNSLGLLFTDVYLFLTAFAINFVLAFFAYLVARRNGIEMAMLLHISIHIFLYLVF